MIYLATLGFALLLTLALTPLAGMLGRRWGLVDAPGGRRKHKGVIPRTGGLALFGGFFITVLLVAFLPDWLPPVPHGSPPATTPTKSAGWPRCLSAQSTASALACSTTVSTSNPGRSISSSLARPSSALPG